MANGAIEYGEGREMRLDPFHLPHKVTFDRKDGLSYSIDRNGAVMKRELTCGLPVSMALPVWAFQGVAARALQNEDGSTSVSLVLYHHDADCCLPVLISDNLDDIAADWHAWSRMLKLPMLMIGADDEANPVREQLGAIMVEAPLERRKRFGWLKHRPNFLRRRKVGVVGKVERISAAEIIARR